MLVCLLCLLLNVIKTGTFKKNILYIFQDPPSERNSQPPPSRDSAYIVGPTQPATPDEILLDYNPSQSLQGTF